MNQKNLDFLKDSLKYLGFGDKLNGDLETSIKQQPAQFQLSTVSEFKKDKIEENVAYTLDFKKSEQNDMYFLNRYRATLQNPDKAKEVSQTFYINKNSGITAKEAYNLLAGRAVNKDLTNKEGQAFNAWVQLDFLEKDKNDNFKVKQFHQGYGFDLDKVLAKYPIKELGATEQKEQMVRSLEKGNMTSVTFVKDSKEEKMYITANPQYKSLNVYDLDLKKIFQGNEKKEGATGPDKSKENKETQKQEADEEPGPQKQKKTRKKGVGV